MINLKPFLFCIIVCVHDELVGAMHVTAQIWRSEDNLVESFSSGDGTQVSRLARLAVLPAEPSCRPRAREKLSAFYYSGSDGNRFWEV